MEKIALISTDVQSLSQSAIEARNEGYHYQGGMKRLKDLDTGEEFFLVELVHETKNPTRKAGLTIVK